ncbi:hypothetical protein D3C83_82060 [compost metagenome]
MVGAPDVDDHVETALELVQMVRDIRRKISVLSVFALEDTVLFVAEFRRAEPLGPVLEVNAALLFERHDRALDHA